MPEIMVNHTTQQVVVSPAGSSVGVVNAGPIGPPGPPGTPGEGEVSGILDTDGQLITRAGGVLVPITRADLANDAAFTGKYVGLGAASANGDLLTRTAPGVIAGITRAALALDAAWTLQYMPLAILTSNGDILTRSGGVPIGISRSSLAADSAWSSLYAAVPTAWTAATLINSWANTGSPYNVAQYRKFNDMVQLRGVIDTGTSATVAFVLPSGFRPPASIRLGVPSSASFGLVEVDTSGNVTCTRPGTTMHLNCQFSITS